MKDYMKLSATTMVLGGLGAAALLYMIFKPKEEAKPPPPSPGSGQGTSRDSREGRDSGQPGSECSTPTIPHGAWNEQGVCVAGKP